MPDPIPPEPPSDIPSSNQSESPPSTPPTVPSDNTEVPSSQKSGSWKILALILGLVAIASLSTTAWLLLKPAEPSPNTENSPETVPEVETSPTPDPQTSLQIYESKVHNFSLRYPNTLTFTDHSVEKITQFELARDNTAKFIVRASAGNESSYYLDHVPSREITIAGQTAKIYEFPNGYGDGGGNTTPLKFVAVVFYQDGIQYALEAYNTLEIDSTFDQILSTFKFLDEEIDTINWQIYTDNVAKFSFKYPLDWKFRSPEITIPGKGVSLVKPGSFYLRGIDIVTIPNDSQRLTAQEAMDNRIQELKGLVSPEKAEQVEDKTIGNLTGKWIYDPYAGTLVEAFFPHSDIIIHASLIQGGTISAQNPNEPAVQEDFETFIQILSTFRFLE